MTELFKIARNTSNSKSVIFAKIDGSSETVVIFRYETSETYHYVTYTELGVTYNTLFGETTNLSYSNNAGGFYGLTLPDVDTHVRVYFFRDDNTVECFKVDLVGSFEFHDALTWSKVYSSNLVVLSSITYDSSYYLHLYEFTLTPSASLLKYLYVDEPQKIRALG